MTTIGTAYFVSPLAALRYYREYGATAGLVATMIRDGTIHIGRPPTRPGDRLSIIDDGTRYAITEAAPCRS